MSVKRFIPWILFISIFIPLTITSYPSISWWNSGGYASGAFSLGIPDPGGSILFILLGKVFAVLLFFLPVIKAIMLVSITASSLAAVLLYYSLIAIFDNINHETSDTVKTTAAFIVSLSAPFMYSIWIESVAVQAYSLGLFLTGLLIFCSVKIWFSYDDKEKKGYIYLTAFLMGLDFTAHRLNTPFIPVFVLLMLFPLRKQLTKIQFWLAIAGLYLMGISLNLYLLFRSPMNPAYAMDDIRNFGALMDWITMKRFGESNFSILFNRRAPFWDYQVNHMYLRYFGWNFTGSMGEGTIFNKLFLSFIPIILGIYGFIYSLIKKFRTWILIFTAFLFYSFGLVLYSNIREGFDMMREIDRLFIPSFYVFLIFTGIGFYLIFFYLHKFLMKLRIPAGTGLLLVSLFGCIILPVNIFMTNLPECNKSGFFFPEDFAYNMLAGCEKNAILFTNGDNDTYPLWYLQTVEGIRPDITVVNLPLLNTSFYVSQLQRKYKIFSGNSEIFSDEKFRPSLIDTAVSLKLEGEGLTDDSRIDSLVVEYGGRDFGRKKGLLPQDKALISLLESNKWKRPVYFASTVYEDNMLGLSGYLCITGIDRKLLPIKCDSIIPQKLRDNLLRKYRYRNFNNPSVYTDRTANSLFNNYRHLFVLLSRYYLEQGNKKEARHIFEEMEARLPDWRFSKSQNEEILNFKPELKE